MRSLLGRFHRPFARGVDEQLLLLNNLGDGSTLSLDFTTGVLDPRLTFTRTTNATFINSQGLVQYADANMVLNSTMLVSTLWTATTSGGGTVTINNDNTVTFASTAGRATWLQTISIQSGLPMTFSIEVTALTNTNIRVSDLFNVGTGFTSQVYNYTDLSGNTTANIGAFTTLPGVGLYTVNATTTAASGNVIFGTDCNGVTRTGSVTIARPQLQYGTRISSRVYLANSSTSAANTNTPRFDYDPSTLQPRGLLIEGSANNIATYSNDFSNAVWTLDTSGGTIPAVSTVSQTGPDGASTVTRITFNKTGGTFSRIRQTLSGTASQPYTMSVWMKANTASGGASTQNVGLRIGADSAGFNCVVTTTWKRFQYTYTLSGTDAAAQIMLWDNIVGNDETADVLVYGCQIEAGSGASSYIPTGASTGSRAADFCTMSSIGSWFNEPSGTFVSKVTYTALSGDNSGIEISVGTGASASNRIGIRKGYVDYYSGGSLSAEMYPTVTSGNVRIATAYSVNDFAMCSNGGTMRTDTTGAVPVGLNTLKLYSDAGTSNTLCLFGWVSSIKYWPTRLPNAQLQALTT
jgi:hypothetical protein